MNDEPFDVVIVGGGPAGLSAAVLLGRCLRRVLVCDAGNPRNAASKAMHGFLGHEGIEPTEFLALVRKQISAYQNVSFLKTTVTLIEETNGAFLTTCGEKVFASRAVILATGVADQLPAIRGVRSFYGRSLHHCPYCDAWEHREQNIGVVGLDQSSRDLAVELLQWSPDITLYTHAPEGMNAEVKLDLQQQGIRVVEGKLAELVGEDGQLQELIHENGQSFSCEALFFSPVQIPYSSLAAGLGCPIDKDNGVVKCGNQGDTGVPGVFIAGNLSEGIQMAIVAAAEGTKAGAGVNDWLSRRGPSLERAS